MFFKVVYATKQVAVNAAVNSRIELGRNFSSSETVNFSDLAVFCAFLGTKIGDRKNF